MPRPRLLWFRCYVEMIHDPKLRRIPPAQRWVWLAVMSAARESPVPGYLLITAAEDDVEPITDEDLADAAAVKLSDVRAALAWFQRMGMLTVDAELECYVVKNWPTRQFETDDVAIRTRRHRAERNGSHPFLGTSLERSYGVPCNVVGTFPGTPPDTETENREQNCFLTLVFRVTQGAVHRQIRAVA